MPQTARSASRVQVTRTFSDLLAEVHDAHYASLFRYFDRLSGDPDLAADIVQEAFVRLYRRGALPDRPDRWLVTVALNLFRNERATARRRGALRLERAPDLSPAGFPTPADRVEGLERRARVRAALDRLSRRERELLLLRAEGYGYRDLAAILELNEASVGTLLARAKRAFQASWGKE
ncbi:MAG TPA: sigma-70 family RNA polymerase sigma factor [Gemmatimonadota bacterium]|jgi:RNA polymerase sigma-70 factor (ECF subfamily)